MALGVSSFIIKLMAKDENSSQKVLGAVGAVGSYLSPRALFGKNTSDETEVHQKATVQQVKHAGISWIDIQNPDNKALKELADKHSFESFHQNISILEQTPSVEAEKNYTYLLIYVASPEDDNGKTTTRQLGIFIGRNYLITIHKDTIPFLATALRECEQDDLQRKDYFGKSSSHLLSRVVTDLTDDLSVLIKSVLQELDAMEDTVFDTDSSDAYPISRLRQKIIRLKRTTSALRGVITDVQPTVAKYGSESLARHFASNGKATDKLIEKIDEANETIEIYKDADFTASTEKTNEILAILTLIFTFTIPPTVLGTFFGMNILLPGGIETEPWTFLGSYTTLIVVLSLSISFVVVMYLYFKKKKWF